MSGREMMRANRLWGILLIVILVVNSLVPVKAGIAKALSGEIPSEVKAMPLQEPEPPTPTATPEPVEEEPTPTAEATSDIPEIIETPEITPTVSVTAESETEITGIADTSITFKASPGYIRPEGTITLSWQANLPEWKADEGWEIRLSLPPSLTAQLESGISARDGVVIVSLSDRAISSIVLQVSSQPIEEDTQLIHMQLYRRESLVLEKELSLQVTRRLVNLGESRITNKEGNIHVTFPADLTRGILDVILMPLDEGEGSPLSTMQKTSFVIEAFDENGDAVHQFDKEITIEIAYDETLYTNNESTLGLYYYDEESFDWKRLPGKVDIARNLLTGYSDHLTVFNPDIQNIQVAIPPTVSSFQTAQFTGASTYSLPLTLPSGPANFQPSLTLNYNSQIVDNASMNSQASWVGMGWSLDTGTIVRNMNGTMDDTNDDTFNVSFNGVSDLMLKDTNGLYHTTDESFYQIEIHGNPNSTSSWWEIWAKDGTRYRFGYDPNATHSHAFFARCPDPESVDEIPYQWRLSHVTNAFNQTITYTYTQDARTVHSLGCTEDGMEIDVWMDYWIYPAQIRYPNNRYRVVFNWGDRRDYKHEWSLNNLVSTRVLYQNKRLESVVTEHNPDGDAGFLDTVPILKYKFTYANDDLAGINNTIIWPNLTWNAFPLDGFPNSNKTLTLIRVQEQVYQSSTSTWLEMPPTTFNYGSGDTEDGLSYPEGDGQHLFWGENGYGGRVEFTYDAWALNDPRGGQTLDYNDAQQNMFWKIGKDDTGGVYNYTIPFTPNYLYHPGAVYEWRYTVQPYSENDPGITCSVNPAPCIVTTSINDGVSGLGNIHSIIHEIPYGTWRQTFTDRFILNGDAKNSLAHFNLQVHGAFLYNISYRYLPAFYRVTQKRTIDQISGEQTDVLYTYSDPKVNDDNLNTPKVNRFIPSYTEFRGHAEVEEIQPDGRVTQTTYTQTYPKQGLVNSVRVTNADDSAIYSLTGIEYDNNSASPFTRSTEWSPWQDVTLHWNRKTAETHKTFSGDINHWTGTSTEYFYDPAHQGGSQFGNVTLVEESTWGGSGWAKYRATKTLYVPSISAGTRYLVLPAYRNRYACPGEVCDYQAGDLTASEVFIYDDSDESWDYLTPASAGILTVKRTLLYQQVPGDNNSGRYSDETYAYDSRGNINSTSHYPGEGTVSGSLGTRGGGTPAITRYCYGLPSGAPTCTDDGYGTYMGWAVNSMNHVTRWEYDKRLGLLTKETDPNGVETNAYYDGYGRIERIVRPGDSYGSPTQQYTYHMTLPYWSTGQDPYWTELAQRIDGTNFYRLRKFYDGLGRMIQTQTAGAVLATGTRDVVTDMAYNGYGQIIQQTVPYEITPGSGFHNQELNQAHTETEYDLLGRARIQTATDGSVTEYQYSIVQVTGLGWVQQTVTRDALMHETTTLADAWGRSVKTLADGGSQWVKYAYDTKDQLIQVTESGITPTVQLTYDLGGRKTQMVDPDMGMWTYHYDALGNLTTQTDARGCAIVMSYDLLNRLTGKTYTGPGACDPTSDVSYKYDSYTAFTGYTPTNNNPVGQRTGMVDGSGQTIWEYDARGRKVVELKTITGSGVFKTGWVYNSADLLQTTKYPSGNTGSTGEEVTTSYTPQMLAKQLTSTLTPTSLMPASQYDAAGRLTSRTLITSSLYQSYTYNGWSTDTGAGRLQKAEVQRLDATLFSDSFGSIYKNANWTWYVPVSGPTYTLAIPYGGGQIKGGGGEAVVLSSGPCGIPPYPRCPLGFLEIEVPGSASFDHTSTVNRAPQMKTDLPAGNGDWSVESKVFIRERDQGGVYVWPNVQYTHAGLMLYFSQTDIAYWGFYGGTNLKMTRSTTSDQINVTNTSSDIWLRIRKVASQYYFDYKTSAGGNWTNAGSLTWENPPTKTGYIVRTWNPSSVWVDFDDFVLKQLGTTASFEYGYDEVGNITSIHNSLESSYLQEYLYDNLNRLTSAILGGEEETYAYDEESGLLTDKGELEYQYGSASHPHAVIQADGTLYGYDSNGNMETHPFDGNTHHLVYDGENRLVKVYLTDPNSPLAVFTYDADGSRVKGIVNGVATVYIGDYLEWTGSTSTMKKYYYHGSTRVAVREGSSLYYLVGDHLGSTSLAYDTNGNKVGEMRYKAWGEDRYVDGTIHTARKYTGQVEEPGLGLYFYQARFYDSLLSRFTSADTLIPQPGNVLAYDRYSYSWNNPLRYTDPSGHDIWDSVGDFATGFVYEFARTTAWYSPHAQNVLSVNANESGERLAGRIAADVAIIAVGVVEVSAGVTIGTGGTAVSCVATLCVAGVATVGAGAVMAGVGATTALAGAAGLGGNLAQLSGKTGNQLSSGNSADIFTANNIPTQEHFWDRLAENGWTDKQAFNAYKNGTKYTNQYGQNVRWDPKSGITIIIDPDDGRVITTEYNPKPMKNWERGWFE